MQEEVTSKTVSRGGQIVALPVELAPSVPLKCPWRMPME